MDLAGIMNLMIQHQIKQSEHMHKKKREEAAKRVEERTIQEAKDRLSVQTQLLKMQQLQQKHVETL